MQFLSIITNFENIKMSEEISQNGLCKCGHVEYFHDEQYGGSCRNCGVTAHPCKKYEENIINPTLSTKEFWDLLKNPFLHCYFVKHQGSGGMEEAKANYDKLSNQAKDAFEFAKTLILELENEKANLELRLLKIQEICGE